MSALDPGIYGAAFYAKHATGAVAIDSQAFGRAIGELLKPSTAVDFGCAAGAVLRGVLDACPGVEVTGFDHQDAVRAVLSAHLSLIPADRIRPWNVYDPPRLLKADIAICSEVGEHLPGVISGRLVDHVIAGGKTVVWTAAIPHQGGDGHINEQPPAYWERLFNERGWVIDRALTVQLRDAVLKAVSSSFWYYNCFVYVPRA
jgi:hypothetical protein